MEVFTEQDLEKLSQFYWALEDTKTSDASHCPSQPHLPGASHFALSSCISYQTSEDGQETRKTPLSFSRCFPW